MSENLFGREQAIWARWEDLECAPKRGKPTKADWATFKQARERIVGYFKQYGPGEQVLAFTESVGLAASLHLPQSMRISLGDFADGIKCYLDSKGCK